MSIGLDKYYDILDEIDSIVKKELFGPVEDDELITAEPPIKYYSIGILYPRGIMSQVENDVKKYNQEKHNVSGLKASLLELDPKNENDVGINDEVSNDDDLALTNNYFPSSIAMSTKINQDIKDIEYSISYGQYHYIEDKKDELKGWKRQEFHFNGIINVSRQKRVIKNISENLDLHLYITRENMDGSRSITIALVNSYELKQSHDVKEQSEKAFFQVNLNLFSSTVENLFLSNKKNQSQINDNNYDTQQFDMLYSHVGQFAVGHGCAVDWQLSKENPLFARELKAVYMPKEELLQMRPNSFPGDKTFEIKFLSSASKEDVCSALTTFCDKYERWIHDKSKQVKSLDVHFHEMAQKNIENCLYSLLRMKRAISLLRTNNQVFTAFRYANESMLIQRKQYFIKNHKQIDEDTIRWYPFQLGFILQEIESIVNKESVDRDKVDLLWFPTGGGKTEAYLGLTAFLIFYRRLFGTVETSGGVTVIMRYTLRLLTMQQFERAHIMICACELIRKREELGGEMISLGLFVGSSVTPNKRSDAQSYMENKYCKNSSQNPVVIVSCPWCGDTISASNYQFKDDKMIICCSNPTCEFHRGLPAFVIDEDIYEHKPTMIISTIDKFAQLTWVENIRNIFGLGGEFLPPELIIQDELHLISGPLGTIAGLYEVAFRKLCEGTDGNSIKVIASTATIRNAQQQIKLLYGKDYFQFPPQALNIRDSFFAVESTREEKGTRTYIGIMAPGLTSVTIESRVYAALLFATRYLLAKTKDEEHLDAYLTLVGYYNTIRQLGGAQTLIKDVVVERLKFLTQTKFKKIVGDLTINYLDGLQVEELTSRVDSIEIPEILKILEQSYPNTKDIVLASNMISVGIDVNRFGVMVMNNQPKMNSEYIQATSRVGRSYPGVVYTVYNVMRSRDKSHFEQFKTYHSCLYKYVEPTSVTPFSLRSREKALHAIYISLIRHLYDEMSRNMDAGNFYSLEEEKKNYVFNYILHEVKKMERANLVKSNEVDELTCELKKFIKFWETQSFIHGNNLYYNAPGKLSLISRKSENRKQTYITLDSMRNVDETCNIYIQEGES